MKHFNIYKRIIAISERSEGNGTIGEMWVDTKSFDKATPISEIIEWGKSTNGKLSISIDEDSVENDLPY